MSWRRALLAVGLLNTQPESAVVSGKSLWTCRSWRCVWSWQAEKSCCPRRAGASSADVNCPCNHHAASLPDKGEVTAQPTRDAPSGKRSACAFNLCCQVARRRASAPRSGIAEDQHQQIVEVVSDTARQLANGFGPARLLQLRFNPEPGGDVGADTEDRAGSTIRVADQGPATRDHNRLSALSVSSAWTNSSCMPSLHEIASGGPRDTPKALLALAQQGRVPAQAHLHWRRVLGSASWHPGSLRALAPRWRASRSTSRGQSRSRRGHAPI